jgi:flagellar protein FlaG
MKVDNVVNSTINVLNAPVTAPKNGETAVTRKPLENLTDKEQNTENVQTQPETVTKEKLNKTIEVANNAFKEVNIGFKYSIDKKINREVVEVVNTQTGETIRQYPPEEIINMLSRMYDMLGILIDKKM